MRWTKVGETDRHGHGPARPISQPFCTCLWGRSKGEMINTIFFKTCLLIEAMVNWLTKLSINVFNEHKSMKYYDWLLIQCLYTVFQFLS